MDGLTTLRALELTSLDRLTLPYYAIETLTALHSANITSLEGLDQTSLEALTLLQSVSLSDHYFSDALTSLRSQNIATSSNGLSILRSMEFTKLETLSVPYYTMNALTQLRGMDVTSLESLDWSMREALTALQGLDFTRHGLDQAASAALTSLGRL